MSAAPVRRPQLTPEELQQLRWLLGGALILLAVWTVFYMDVEAWTLMALTTIAAGAALVRPTLPARVPRIFHTLAFPAIVLFFAADLWIKTEVLPAMVRLDILLLLYRSISYRQRRDDLQVIVLGLFLIVVAGVLTVSLTFAVQILLYTACALTFLLVITLTDATTGKVPVKKLDVPDGPPAWAVHTDWAALFRRLRAAADWRVIGLGVVLFVGVVGVSALLFLAIPRFQLQNSMFLDRFITKKARSGFSEMIRFGDITEITQDESVALSVDVSDQTQIPGTPYWRMLILDNYDNGTFKLSPWSRQQLFTERPNWLVTGGNRQRTGPRVQWTFFLEPGVSSYLPLIGHFERLEFTEVQNFRHAPRLVLLSLRQEPATMTAYRVEGFVPGPAIADPRFAELLRDPQEVEHRRVTSQRALFLDAADLATLDRLLREAVGEQPLTTPVFAARLNAWLRQKHQYSLKPRIPEGPGDSLVRWAASTEAGHCELFAGSFVLMARRAGFYTRVVTGFKGGSWNAFSSNFTIRNADAHAWVEIFDEATGAWLRTDPLEASAATQAGQEATGQAAIAARTDRSWSARLDSLRVFWYRRIVSFDQRSQIETLKAVKEATESSGRRLREAILGAIAATKAWATSPWSAQRFYTLSLVAGGFAALIWLWRSFGRTWWRGLIRPRGPRGDDPVRREAGQWLRRITALEMRPPETAVVAADLQRLRFGARETWARPDSVFKRARAALRAARRSVADRKATAKTSL